MKFQSSCWRVSTKYLALQAEMLGAILTVCGVGREWHMATSKSTSALQKILIKVPYALGILY